MAAGNDNVAFIKMMKLPKSCKDGKASSETKRVFSSIQRVDHTQEEAIAVMLNIAEVYLSRFKLTNASSDWKMQKRRLARPIVYVARRRLRDLK